MLDVTQLKSDRIWIEIQVCLFPVKLVCLSVCLTFPIGVYLCVYKLEVDVRYPVSSPIELNLINLVIWMVNELQESLSRLVDLSWGYRCAPLCQTQVLRHFKGWAMSPAQVIPLKTIELYISQSTLPYVIISHIPNNSMRYALL